MQYGRAFIGGVLGGVAALSVLVAAELAGLRVDLVLAFGEAPGVPRGTNPWFLGFAATLMLTGLVGLLYAWSFRVLDVPPDWRIGAAPGTIRASVTGILLGLVPSVGTAPAPGFFMVNLGLAGVAVELLVHMVYGTVVGTFGGATTPSGLLGSGGRLGEPDHAHARGRP